VERQLLAVKNALIIKRQAEASADFATAMGTMASEISRMFGETDLVKTQMEWERAMAQSQTMEERTTMFLDLSPPRKTPRRPPRSSRQRSTR
jgi:hypothetical protein